jgi:xanthine dehydrogenase YagS FAD-binding subunit
MKSFEYAAPSSVREAAGLLADGWGKTEVLAGGTDLITSMKQNLIAPERVVSLRNIAELKGISETGGAIRVGAMTTLAELSSHALVKEYFPALVTAAEGVGSTQMMSMGTVGGDLCQRPRCWYFRNELGPLVDETTSRMVREGDNRYHAIFGNDGLAVFVSPSSLGPALIALDAKIRIEGPGGQSRTIRAVEFFQTPKNDQERQTVLKPNEILTSLEVPLAGLKNAAYEIRHRHGLDWPYVTAAVAFDSRGGTVSNTRVVLGHVAPVPWLAPKAGEALNGSKGDESAASKCAAAAVTGAKPLSQNGYKVQLVKTAVKRAVLAAAKA